MTDRREDDMASIAWPGFVDILSAVIIMFVFFVMVIVVVLYIYTIKFTATVEQQAQQQIEETIRNIDKPKDLRELEEDKKKTREEIEELKEQKIEIQKEIISLQAEKKGVISKIESDTQHLFINGKEILIIFEHNAVTLTKDVVHKIEDFLINTPMDASFVIQSGDDPFAATQSSSREVNLSRMMNLRNIVLSSGYKPSQVSVNYVEEEEVKGSYSWIRMKLE